MTLVRLEHWAPPSRVKHSTTEPLRSNQKDNKIFKKVDTHDYFVRKSVCPIIIFHLWVCALGLSLTAPTLFSSEGL